MYGHVLPIRNTGTGQARSYAASVPGGLSRRESKVEAENEFATRPLRATEIDPRRHPRFKLGVDIIIHSRTCGVLKGHTVDISESGISAIMRIEVPLGEIVELDFTLPFGPVTTYATVRQRSAFRYGFQFLELTDVEAIRRTCRQLAVEQALISPDSL
ncbi:MAG TPA: PilZ domain-containing protein [Terriglobales bacterium]|nr:PilZ domain-containing protein [Terriglobales bacterium]